MGLKLDKLASTPAGLQVLYAIDKCLRLTETTFEWIAISPQQDNDTTSREKDATNGDEAVRPDTEEVPTRPAPWFIFLPYLIVLRHSYLVLNMVLSAARLPPIQFKDVKWKLYDLRKENERLRNIGSQMLENKQEETEKKLKERPFRMNFICRVFSRYPFSVFVRLLRRVLNYVGIITLPRPQHLRKPHLNGSSESTDNEPEKQPETNGNKPAEEDSREPMSEEKQENSSGTASTNEETAGNNTEADQQGSPTHTSDHSSPAVDIPSDQSQSESQVETNTRHNELNDQSHSESQVEPKSNT